MTREQFENMDFDELIEYTRCNIGNITTEEVLKDYAIEKIQGDDFNMAIHILNALNDSPYGVIWYRYDYSMGTFETPTPITKKENIEDLILFDDVE